MHNVLTSNRVSACCESKAASVLRMAVTHSFISASLEQPNDHSRSFVVNVNALLTFPKAPP